MAGLGKGKTGMFAAFEPSELGEQILDRYFEWENKAVEALRYAGEEFVRKARNLNTYSDQTGNLRSSIGYVIMRDGALVDGNFDGTRTGVDEANKVVQEVKRQHPRGLVLIGVAGMNYAAAVEAKGYDVISGSAPDSEELKDLLSAIEL